MMKARCGHLVGGKYAEAHDGLCRSCHSNFAFLIDLESEYGEDALVQYWYAMILANLNSAEERAQGSDCLIEHLVEFYQSKLDMVPSKSEYIRKMLYMLNSLRKPFDIEAMK
jgi:hypothetical protein